MVNVLPNQFVGALGEHDGYPIERLALSADGNTLASCSHDCTVKLWDLAVVDDDDEDDAKEEEEEEINEEPEEQSECSAGGRSEHDELDNELEEITGIANASINSTDTVGDSNDSDVTTALRTRKKPRKRKANDILPGTASATRNRFFDDLM